MSGQHIASFFKHESNMTKKDKEAYIRYLAKEEGANAAMRFWLTHAGSISKKKFMELLK
jgi:hypothetical protein